MRILLAGGSGFLGTYLNRALLRRGHDVEFVTRQKEPTQIMWKDLKKWDCLPYTYDSIVNLCGTPLHLSRKWNEQSDVYSSRIGTNLLLTKLIAQTKEKYRPKSYITPHYEGIYPRHIGASSYDESYFPPEVPTDSVQKLCYHWEKSAQLPAEVKNVRQVGLRIGPVLAWDGGIARQAFMRFYCGFGGKWGTGKQAFSWIHAEDLTELFVYAIENRRVTGMLNACAPVQNTSEEFVRAYASGMNRPCLVHLPEGALNTYLGKERAALLTGGATMLPKRTLETGFRFRHTNLNKVMDEICSLR